VGRGTRPGHGALEALLDSRHFSTDGRLGHWTPAQVERALLHWIPGKVTATPEDLLGAPETLRSLLRYLEATGLRDPRGATVAENEAAIEAAAAEFSAAIADPDRYGLAKTMALAAGLDQPEAIQAFLQGGPGPLPDVDPEIVRAAIAGGAVRQRRTAKTGVATEQTGEAGGDGGMLGRDLVRYNYVHDDCSCCRSPAEFLGPRR
jgi:hypothetical protein